jgi:tau tubulin kinase
MLNALEELHSLGFVHRDVKPSNFAIQEDKGNKNGVILLDFGLCRQFRTPNGEVKKPRDNTQFRCVRRKRIGLLTF